MNRGFLRTAAPLASDLTLIVEIIMGLALLAGMMLARRGRYRAHAGCQSAVVLLNLIPITLSMAPSFRRSFAPPLPASLDNLYYGLAAVHAALGAVAELLGLYILAVAGTAVVPKRLQFSRYKLWMRTALVTWWLVLFLGVATYVRWYVTPLLQYPFCEHAPLRTEANAGIGPCCVNSIGQRRSSPWWLKRRDSRFA